jgi:hypothetical protein
MAEDDWKPVGKPAQPETTPNDWQPVSADFNTRFTAVDTPRPFLDRLSLGFHGALNRMGEQAVEGAKQLQKGVGEVRGTTEPEGLSDAVKQTFGIGGGEPPERIKAAERHWQITRGFGNILAGGGAYMWSPSGLLSGGLQEATRTYTQNPYPQEATEIFADVIGPAVIKWGADAMKIANAEKVIGGMPDEKDFKTGARAVIAKHLETAKEAATETKEQAHETIEQAVDVNEYKEQSENVAANLKRLWESRGLHPAEAVEEANHNALARHDLMTQQNHPVDKSGITPVVGSPVADGARSALAHTGDPNVDIIFRDKMLRDLIDNPVIDRNSTVPYGAGGSVPFEKPDVHIDRNFPRSFTVDGVTFDPAEPLTIHENAEQFVMERLEKNGVSKATAYKIAHWEYAEKVEGAWYKAHGIDQEEAEKQYKPYLEAIQREKPTNVPADLFKDPYPHDSPFAAAHEALAEPKPTQAEIAQARAILEKELAPGEEEGTPHSLGAAAAPPLTPLARQPLSRPGSLVAAGRYLMDQYFSLSRSIQHMLDPMSAGTPRSQVIAEDAMNSVRAIDWVWRRIDDDIQKKFTPEQQGRMWAALQEESIAIQRGESREHQGLATLEPDERAYITGLQARSQAAWQHAVDAGIVEGEGLPAYSPRMMLNVAAAGAKQGPRALNGLGRNVFTRTAQMKRRKYMEPEETEAAAKELVRSQMERQGATKEEIDKALEDVKLVRNIRTLPKATADLEKAAIWKTMIDHIEQVGKSSGRPLVANHQVGKGWFTIADNPAFTKWGPDFVKEGETVVPRRDENGEIIFTPKPIFLAPEFKGPMTAILDPEKTFAGHQVYDALMAFKGRTMTAIMNSPLVHNEVVWSKVAEAVHFREWGGFHLYWRGNRVVNSPRAVELIEHGLNPIGHRGSFQDISAMMEEPSFTAGRSWTSKLLSFIPGLFDPAAGNAVDRAIDKAGNVTHNTLLWDRVRDLQFGLADHLSDRLVAEGRPRVVADRIASYFSNIIIGSLPKEAMSTGARMVANLLMFSRSFTVGNLLVYKAAVTGLPKPLLAQIARDYGIEVAEGAESSGMKLAKELQTANATARRRALSTIAMSIGMFYVGNALLQNALNVAMRDSNLPDEMKGYARRYHDMISAVKNDPWELRHALARLSPTYDNEPGKQDRVLLGYDRDGTGIYIRNPTGKYGEETMGFPTHPAQMVLSKMSPLAGGLLDALENNRGFGHRIYDENDTSDYAAAATAWNVAKHIVGRQLPEMQMQGGWDMIAGHGDPLVNALKFAGPFFGFTASEGVPGGPAMGVARNVKNSFESRFDVAWPGIRRQIQNGDEAGGRAALQQLGTPPQMLNALVRNAKNPAQTLHGRTLRNFYQEASPEDRARYEANQPQ